MILGLRVCVCTVTIRLDEVVCLCSVIVCKQRMQQSLCLQNSNAPCFRIMKKVTRGALFAEIREVSFSAHLN